MSIRDFIVTTETDCQIQTREYIVSNATCLAIFAHPYGPLGGSQDDAVIVALAKRLQCSGIKTITFDFSSPTSWTGKKERAEYAHVLQYMLECEPQVMKVVLGGYSYGTLCIPFTPNGLSTAYVLVSPLLPPVSTFLTMSLVDIYAKVKQERHLVIWGDQDNFTSSKRLQRAWPDGSVVRNANHFWRTPEAMMELERRVVDFVNAWRHLK